MRSLPFLIVLLFSFSIGLSQSLDSTFNPVPKQDTVAVNCRELILKNHILILSLEIERSNLKYLSMVHDRDVITIHKLESKHRKSRKLNQVLLWGLPVSFSLGIVAVIKVFSD